MEQAFLSRIPQSWKRHLAPEFKKPYFVNLRAFLQAEKQSGEQIFPNEQNIFAGLSATPLDEIKIVILGQDPYHGEGQAHGLSFSVQDGVRVPPSLRNIYKELQSDLGLKPSYSGNLTPWAKQGVLLLNSVLTVRAGQAASHRNKGWEQFTDEIINVINQHTDRVVFLLWGSDAQSKGKSIDESKHLVLKAPHPSPLSAYRGFLGCKHFSQANAYLRKHKNFEIDWRIDR